jgi:hypothetical protein
MAYFNDIELEMLSLDDNDIEAFIERQLTEKQECESGRTESDS